MITKKEVTTMIDVEKELKKLADEKYREFNSSLIPGIRKETFLGVRVPDIRNFEKTFSKTNEAIDFLNSLPHKYFDENMLHAVMLSKIKDIDEAIKRMQDFLPFVDNWAVCDTLNPKVFKKYKEILLEKIKLWINSDKEFTVRFAIKMLMTYFLDGDFKTEYAELVSSVKRDEYYIKMMVSWYFATALAKQWDSILPFIENRVLDEWSHQKSIQKAVESYRITDEQKKYLKKLR